MKSIKMKILLPLFLIIMFFLIFMTTQFIHTRNNLNLVKEMNNKYFATIQKTDKLKLDVVEVQQWLTDASATGDKDGFAEAERYAQDIKVTIEELKQINPEIVLEIEKIDNNFEPYYEKGKMMAEAYVDGGKSEGNLYMGDFDSAAEAINSEVDNFENLASKNIEMSIKNIEKSIENTIILIVISILGVIMLSIAAWIYVTKSIVSPITTILSKLKSIANNDGDLTQRIDFVSKDEIGELAKNFNLMQESFRNIIRVIMNESHYVEDKVKETNDNISQLSVLIQNVYSTTEELSSSMEETAASTEEMNIAASEIESDIESITIKAKREAENSLSIKERAHDLKDKAICSKETARQINLRTQ